MKFASGYLLGAATVVGLGVAFLGGIYSAVTVQAKKTEKLQAVQADTDIDAMWSLVRERIQSTKFKDKQYKYKN